MPESLKEAIRAFIPSEYYLPVLFLLGLIAVLILLYSFGHWYVTLRPHRPNLVIIIVIAVLLLIVMRSHMADRWSWMLGLIPTLLVAYQALFVWLSQPKPNDEPAGSKTVELKEDYRRAFKAVESQFSARSLLLRYGFPAALLGIIGIVAVNVLIKPGGFLSLLTLLPDVARRDDATVARILMGLRIGAVGAYVYVLLELGRRTFRHDVTSGSAMWCLVTMILGPVLAATVALLWRMNVPPPGTTDWWAGGVVLFFAGYAPRRVIAAIEQAAIQLLKLGGSAGVVPTRQIPLTQLRGISPQIEERLNEEGIEDVNAIAAADPLRLYRNTSFDLRQILTWIDEAILIVSLPRSWQALEEEGITGAMDLANHGAYLYVPGADPTKAEAERVTLLTELADRVKINPSSLLATIRRLSENHQLRYIWALYNRFTDSGTGTGDGGAVETATSGDASQPG